ncbi:hypothetical protein C8J57DRAFT_1576692, partial [Mycena rebaudengoi]
MSTISSPGSVPLAFPRPASLTKSPTTSRFRDNSTNNDNTTNVNSSPTPRSRTNSLFDSPGGGSPHRSTPSIDDLKPNAHAYLIRTTSTALLTRSNSTSSQQQNGGRHHYAPPPSPHPSPHRERTSSNVSASGDGNGGGSTGKAGGERKGEYRGHCYSRSLSSSEGMAYGGVASESPRALPMSPGFDTSPDNKGITTALSHKPWTPAWLAAYLGGEARDWFFLRCFLLFSPPFIYPRPSIPPLRPASSSPFPGVSSFPLPFGIGIRRACLPRALGRPSNAAQDEFVVRRGVFFSSTCLAASVMRCPRARYRRYGRSRTLDSPLCPSRAPC